MSHYSKNQNFFIFLLMELGEGFFYLREKLTFSLVPFWGT